MIIDVKNESLWEDQMKKYGIKNLKKLASELATIIPIITGHQIQIKAKHVYTQIIDVKNNL